MIGRRIGSLFLTAVLILVLLPVSTGCEHRPPSTSLAREGSDFRQLSDSQCVKMLTHRNPLARRQAVAELAARGGRVVPLVCPLLESTSRSETRTAAAEVLAKLGPQAADAAPALAKALADKTWSGRELAAIALGEIGDCSSPCLSSLRQALCSDPEPQVRSAAARALGKIAAAKRPIPQEVTLALVEALRDPEPIVQAEAAESLSFLPTVPPEAIQTLQTLTTSEHFIVRQAAEEALRRLSSP